MMTFATAFRIRTSSDDQLIAKTIVYGFSGCLYSWWSHLPELEKDGIMNATKVKQEDGSSMTTQKLDAVTTLIYSIIKHFIGDPNMYIERSSEQLTNLTCPSLQDFKWYKDIFITKVLERGNNASAFWKERFIAGLPRLFAERVRNKLRERFHGSIPYVDLTYGQLTAFINNEGLALCTDLKLNAKLKKDSMTTRKELRDFCEQYGY